MTATVATELSADPTALFELYRRMRLIRQFEDRASRLYRTNEIPGFLHLSIGQEASAVGACWPLDDRDVVTSTHRGHGHCIAKGLDVTGMFAELMGRRTGTCQGRGGSMHIADPRKGIFGANGIVAAGLPIATGAATAAQLRGRGGVVLAFFGDGAVAQGMFHEAVNLAAVWQLPVIFCCENNHYAEFSAAADQHRATLADRARGYGVEYAHVDGNDVVAVADTVTALVADLRAGAGPVLLEAETYRWHGHYEGDPERYREPEELAAWKERDPLPRLAARLDPGRIAEIDHEIDILIEKAVAEAKAAEEPAPETLHHYVGVPREPVAEPPEPTGEIFRTMDAVHEALDYELGSDEGVFVAGIDVGAGGNVFGLTRGLAEKYPGRVRDTPISESAVVGVGVGAAMAGMRPVVELMYMDFIGVCLDQLMNQAAKLRFMTGGAVTLPLVVRTQFGAGKSSGSQHSQSLEALLAHIPGLTVVMPSTPADTYGLLRAAIRDPNPVVFVENRLLYGRKGPRPEPGHLIPLGKAAIRREGTDVTLVSYSKLVHDCVTVAEQLAGEGISVEVIDLRTIAPLDAETVLRSLAKTGRLVIAHQAVEQFGVGAELAALAADEGFWTLDAPVIRVGAAATPAPYAPSLEREWLPSPDRIAAAVRRSAAA
ncbi:2-oxoisovalerate dehydrogenase E1 component [Amycolatopsis mediterranei S699]|uniref:dihydrolipoyllysine-residue succinyltransferase n=2 Tax=Amycolatopsis mediterranei TaxID=33910 RepID=A0A0H3DGS2_AMYMU|nr:alpha-ketoacid dehydrogenase subunit alpha/beta [Amycolatopsis mediterranei]ADJ48839.1 2-oxoisovalerate dehydrogenase E1 component [Amycolatopsis mediterranei U32]AEK45785.1 2-oxoisovalerate dehydrogenase E1 component [Amycolatopsis mediterranei S699]AFO80549.1 2-oxoisovalerate dehydrogenase E1 component [Amycolatopsis mediterranei S699]AGT87677.1 2-oxoisovalerate dehydrogenase E1 component [Amycolatopsis mediterranei RB]KDU94046.1 2-oxoisovalerate dehydrogenase [Amycolatopsis mediterranei]